MITHLDGATESTDRDRMLIVGDCFGYEWVDHLKERYPVWSIATCDSYMEGIAELASREAHAVLACLDVSLAQLDDAVGGLREAVGLGAKLVLCCTPETEPTARRVLASGADDYVLFPIDGEELDAAIGYARPDATRILTAAPPVSMEELGKLSEALEEIVGRPRVLLERIASLIQVASGSRGATVIVEGATATSGEVVASPVLSVALNGASGVIGQLTVGERADEPYTPGDVQKLEYYATLISHLLQAASKQRQWRQLAVTDECSGLPNRRYFHERVDEILKRAANEHFHVTLLLFDVDDFKTYNDTYGHDAGDEIIRSTGELFRQQCREQDVVARYGGDEFAVVFWDPHGPRVAGSRHPDCALAVLNRFKETVRSQHFPNLGPSGQGCLTISGGLATYPWDGTTREELLKRADEALLAAKRAGKNRIFLIGKHED